MENTDKFYFEHTFLNYTGVPHTMMLEHHKTFHNQNKLRFEWSFRSEIEALASQRVYWCTLTYEPLKAVHNYELAKAHNAGRINKYLPPQYKKEYDKFMKMPVADRNTYAHDNKFNALYTDQRFKYFCAARAWLPPKDYKLTNTSNTLQPLYELDRYYYYSEDDHKDLLSDTYQTRTQKDSGTTICNPGFDKFADGFQYTEKQFTDLYDQKKLAFMQKYKKYTWTPSDETLLCKEHIQHFIRKFQRKFVKETGCRVRYMYQGEYGTSHHRAHYHLLIFIPYFCQVLNYPSVIDYFLSWPYGKVKECVEVNTTKKVNIAKVVNYIGKHFIKFDVGNYWQEAMSPVFRQTSTYDGGIGWQLFAQDSPAFSNEILQQYLQLAGAASPVWNINGYKHTGPRYYRRLLFPDYRFSDDQLYQCAHTKLTTVFGNCLTDNLFVPQKKYEKLEDLIKDVNIFVESKSGTNNSEIVNKQFQEIEDQLIELDKAKRKKAYEKYVEYKNKLRKAQDRIEITEYFD